MVRAAASRVIDYSTFDPDDQRWWRRHDWLIMEIARRDEQDAAKIEHAHWAAIMACPNMKPEAYGPAIENARQAMVAYLTAVYPWRADELAKMLRPSAEQFAEQYAELYGRPGEPEYEKMVGELEAALKPVSAAEKRRRQEKFRKEFFSQA
jgi:hypothetical protein